MTVAQTNSIPKEQVVGLIFEHLYASLVYHGVKETKIDKQDLKNDAKEIVQLYLEKIKE